MHYYQFNIGDYASHTRNLSLLEDLAYRRLLDEYYLHERPFNACSTTVARQIGMAEHKDSVEFVLQTFFVLEDAGWISKRAEKEIAHFRSKSEAASRAGKASAERRLNDRSTTVQPTNNQEPVTNNQEPDIKHKVSKDTLSGNIPTCPHHDIVSLFHEVLPELPEVRIWNPTRQGYLKSRWRETALQEKWETQEQGIEWFKKFFAWIRHSKFLMGKVPPNRGGRPFECELEWILKPNNWTKILEGKYHAS